MTKQRESIKSTKSRFAKKVERVIAKQKASRSSKVSRARNLATITKKALGRPQHPVPNFGFLPLRKKMKYTYSYRSDAVNVAAGSFIYDVMNLNSMYDPDGTGNNLGNKNFLGQAVLLNSTYYTEYEVTDFAITFKYTLVSDPTIAPSEVTNTLTSGSGTVIMPGVRTALPIEVWETPFFINSGGEGTAVDTLAEFKKCPGGVRHDLHGRNSTVKFTRRGNVKKILKGLKHDFEDVDIQAAYNASPVAILQRGVYVFNQNAVACSVMCEVEIAISATLYNLKPTSISETYGS